MVVTLACIRDRPSDTGALRSKPTASQHVNQDGSVLGPMCHRVTSVDCDSSTVTVWAGFGGCSVSTTEVRRQALVDTVNGASILAGSANVIMQLARPGVGHGVVESRVESGRIFDHPIKRTRTTLTYLSVAVLGTDEDRAAYRQAVNKAHVQVYSTESSPVEYHGMDPGLQLWVAACLYRGAEDTYLAFHGPSLVDGTESLYEDAAPLGTTLQVRDDMWPATREEFEKYWTKELANVHIDDVVRAYLHAVTCLKFLPRPVSTLLGPFNQFVTTGFLPEEFRREMRYTWTPRQQRRFDWLTSTVGFTTRHLPRTLREFPFNLCLLDLRFRVKRGQAVV